MSLLTLWTLPLRDTVAWKTLWKSCTAVDSVAQYLYPEYGAVCKIDPTAFFATKSLHVVLSEMGQEFKYMGITKRRLAEQ